MYYVITIQNNTIPAIYSYETMEAALAYFHTELAYRHESRTSTRCMIVDSELSLIRQESYVAPVPDNTEEPNEEPVEG